MQKKNYNVYYRPHVFMQMSDTLLKYALSFSIIFGVLSLYLGLVIAPIDYEQGETYKIIYIHVPLAWYAVSIYIFMAVCSAIFLIFKHPLFLLLSKTLACIGLTITGLTLITGSLWGMPMWGTFWVWDARLTSVLILFFLYLAVFFLTRDYDSTSFQKAEVGAVLAVFGVLNIPIIKYSVIWWNTLHQPASITVFKSSIHILMLLPLLTMFIFMGFLILSVFLYKIRLCILQNKILVLKKKYI